MKEEFTLSQTHDDNDRRVNKSGTVNRKIVKFATITEGDEIEIQIMIRGSQEAMKARFGTWSFGLVPDPAQIEIAIGTIGSGITKAQTQAAPIPSAPVASVDDEDEPVETDATSDLDDISSRLDDL